MSQVIKVKKSGGETLTIQVAADATIEDIKCKIAQVDKRWEKQLGKNIVREPNEQETFENFWKRDKYNIKSLSMQKKKYKKKKS